MASKISKQDERAGAEIVHGKEECHKRMMQLLDELGFPSGVLPLKDIVEVGGVRETGFFWLKTKAPYDHIFPGDNSLVRYASEITAYVAKGRMKKITGVKCKQLLLWVPVVEMSIQDSDAGKIHIKIPLGVSKPYPITDFMTPEEKKLYFENIKK